MKQRSVVEDYRKHALLILDEVHDIFLRFNAYEICG